MLLYRFVKPIKNYLYYKKTVIFVFGVQRKGSYPMSCLNYSFNINNFSLCHHRVQTISNSQYNRSIPISSTRPTSFDWSLNLFACANLAADRLIESSQQLEDFRHIVTYMKRIDLRILTSAYSPHFILPTFKYPLIFIVAWKY